MSEKNITLPKEIDEDKRNFSLRPKNLDDFEGQNTLKSNLKTFIKSSIKQNTTLDHIILYLA